MIEVRRLGHATLTTPDLDRQVAYYTEIVGLTLLERDSKRALLASKQGFEAVALEPGPPNALSRLAFQVAPGSDLAELARELAKHGVKSERRSGISPGVADAAGVQGSEGHVDRSLFRLRLCRRRTRPRPASCRSSSGTWPIA